MFMNKEGAYQKIRLFHVSSKNIFPEIEPVKSLKMKVLYFKGRL
jgi:hypothetical protein